jgi:hypothetical protein
MLRSNISIHESGRERIGLGHVVASFIGQGSLQLAYNDSELDFE